MDITVSQSFFNTLITSTEAHVISAKHQVERQHALRDLKPWFSLALEHYVSKIQNQVIDAAKNRETTLCLVNSFPERGQLKECMYELVKEQNALSNFITTDRADDKSLTYHEQWKMDGAKTQEEREECLERITDARWNERFRALTDEFFTVHDIPHAMPHTKRQRCGDEELRFWSKYVTFREWIAAGIGEILEKKGFTVRGPGSVYRKPGTKWVVKQNPTYITW